MHVDGREGQSRGDACRGMGGESDYSKGECGVGGCVRARCVCGWLDYSAFFIGTKHCSTISFRHPISPRFHLSDTMYFPR